MILLERDVTVEQFAARMGALCTSRQASRYDPPRTIQLTGMVDGTQVSITTLDGHPIEFRLNGCEIQNPKFLVQPREIEGWLKRSLNMAIHRIIPFHSPVL